VSDDLDVRIATGFPGHPKTKRLIRRVGHQGAWFFMALLCWVRVNRPGGDLVGLSDEDLELAVDWPGDPGALIAAARECRFIDGTDGSSRMHDWHDHNPWAAGSKARSS